MLTVWLARDSSPYGGSYGIYVSKPRKILHQFIKAWCWETDDDALMHIDDGRWHRAGGLRLKPGEGPVKVRLTVTCEVVK